MNITRRQFVSTSSLSLAAVGLTRLSLVGQTPAAQTPAPQAPPVTKFEEIRRGVGIFTGMGGTIGYLLNADGGIAIDSQYMQTGEICVAGLKQKAPKGLELSDQHPSSCRPHRRQPGVQGLRETHPRP